MGEFELIAQFFKRPQHTPTPPANINAPVQLGIGDDCALLQPAPGMQMAISSDMLVQGRHFFADVDPRTLGHKALAVNLSDLAASGAKPLAFTLALALPEANAAWLQAFAEGLFALADVHGCTLIGGDTTRGPLNICITVLGEVPVVQGKSQALLRSGAQVGDDVYVSGSLGDARLALAALRGEVQLAPGDLDVLRLRLEQPTPRVALGLALRGVASSAIDLSDGLVGDLGHILQASGVGGAIDTVIASNLIANHSIFMRARAINSSSFPDDWLLKHVLAGGDDYELAFTAPVAARTAVQAAALASQTAVTRIGQIEAAPGLRLRDGDGRVTDCAYMAFDHFR